MNLSPKKYEVQRLRRPSYEQDHQQISISSSAERLQPTPLHSHRPPQKTATPGISSSSTTSDPTTTHGHIGVPLTSLRAPISSGGGATKPKEKYKFEYIASEGTNIVYKTTTLFDDDIYAGTEWAGYQGPLVLKMPKDDSSELFKKLSDPRYAVHKYNAIHAGHQHPPAILYKSTRGLGWMSPYFPSARQASDEQIALEIVEQYKKTGRITYDAATEGNYLLVNLNCNGHEVCTSTHTKRDESISTTVKDDSDAPPSGDTVELVDVDVVLRHNKSLTDLRARTPSPALGEPMPIPAALNRPPNKSSRSPSSRPSSTDSLTASEIDTIDDLYRDTYWENQTLNLLRPKTMRINQNLIYLDKQYKANPELSRVFPRAELSFGLIDMLTPLREKDHHLNRELLQSIKDMLPVLNNFDLATQAAIIDGLALAELLPQRNEPTPPAAEKALLEPHKPSARVEGKFSVQVPDDETLQEMEISSETGSPIDHGSSLRSDKQRLSAFKGGLLYHPRTKKASEDNDDKEVEDMELDDSKVEESDVKRSVQKKDSAQSAFSDHSSFSPNKPSI
jgi:hypothetical protein